MRSTGSWCAGTAGAAEVPRAAGPEKAAVDPAPEKERLRAEKAPVPKAAALAGSNFLSFSCPGFGRVTPPFEGDSS